ncbi:MAG: HNH endonuclease signature motif containing protein [Bryobacterales bacterium]|nr:HNH endonuclease signature motif containing protein [Bryobacterales bacterium]MDE0432809.1 HNH endonuclease signature motif containing protein [Bryobacterales bacterium]
MAAEQEGRKWARIDIWEEACQIVLDRLQKEELSIMGDHGPRLFCAGCDRYFDWPEYLQLDHNIPRSEGGSNNLTNRLLLCGPCNRKKSNTLTLTLTGLRRRNQREGFMA